MSRSTMPDNPSAGKFDPPPAPKDPTEPTPLHTRWWFVVLMFATGYPAWHWLLSKGARETLGLAAPVLGLVALAVHYGMQRKRSEERGDDPYSPPTRLTR